MPFTINARRSRLVVTGYETGHPALGLISTRRARESIAGALNEKSAVSNINSTPHYVFKEILWSDNRFLLFYYFFNLHQVSPGIDVEKTQVFRVEAVYLFSLDVSHLNPVQNLVNF